MKRLTPRYPLAELLEIRRLFIVTGSAGFIDSPPTPSFANGILTLTANNNSNTHILSVDNIGRFLVSSRGFPDDPVFIFDYPASVIILDGAGGDDALIVDKSVTFPITVKGGAGRDNLSARTRHVTLDGGPDADILYGSRFADMLSGGGGNDTLLAGDGNDTIIGGGNDDTLVGSAGDDQLIGGDGNDTLNGGDGADYLDGLRGNNLIARGIGDTVWDSGVGAHRIVNPDDLLLYDEIHSFASVSGTGTFTYGMRPKFSNVTVTRAESTPTQIAPGELAYVFAGTWRPLKMGAAANMELATDIAPFDPAFSPYVLLRDAEPGRGHLLFVRLQRSSETLADGVKRLHIAPFGPYGSPSASDPHFPVSIKIDRALRTPTTLIGSDHPDFLRGGSGRDSLIGGGSADTLDGAGGTDTLLGNAGNDSLIGGAGAGDLLIGSYSWDSDFYKTADTPGNHDTIIGDPAADRILTRDPDDVFIAGASDDQ